MHYSDAVTRIRKGKRANRGKEAIRVASEEVFLEFKTLINGTRYGHG